MSNEFYTPTANPAANSSLSSSLIRAEFTALETSFGKLPTMAAKGGQMVIVNAGATALEATGLLSVSGSTLVQNAATITISQNFVETRAVGATASGQHTINDHLITLTGDAGGASDPVGVRFKLTASGANGFTEIGSAAFRANHAGSGLIGGAFGSQSIIELESTGSCTTVQVNRSQIALSSSGNCTTVQQYRASAPTLSSTGAITNSIGFSASNLGHATLITNSISFDAEDHTASITLNAAFRGQMSSGATKYNLYMSGTAKNYLAGQLLIGHTASIATTEGAESKIQIHGTSASTAGISSIRWENATNPGSISLGHSRSGTVGSYTAITTGDHLGRINAVGDDGTDLQTLGARITFGSEGTIASNRIPGNISFWTATDAAPSVLTEAMRINSAQEVLIGGTTSLGTSYKLQVSSSVVLHSTDPGLILSDSDGTSTHSKIGLQFNTGAFAIKTRDSSDSAVSVDYLMTTGASGVTKHSWRIQGTEKMALLSSGLLKITTSTPASASATGTTGTITWDSNYVYIATGTNTWKRAALSTW